MSILLDPPSQLFFERPLTVSASEKLLITNTDTGPIVFKIKTTSPKQYCVRPNSGRINPGEKIEIEILLQPFKEEPPADFKSKDKFLIQAALIPPEKTDLPASQLWVAIESKNKASILERKIRCTFLPPSENTEGDKKPVEPTIPSPVKETTPSLNEDEKKVVSNKSKEAVIDTTPTAEQLASVKDALAQARAIKGQLEKEIETHRNKIKIAENKSVGTSTKVVDTTSDFQVQAMGGIAVVSFLIGVWLF